MKMPAHRVSTGRPMTLRAHAVALILAVLIAGVPAGWFGELGFPRYIISSGSMQPTLLLGDYVIALDESGTPERGEVVAFRVKGDTVFIKRVVGLPGDRVQMIDGVLQINGQAARQERIEDFIGFDDEKTVAIKQWRETLPNGTSYATLDLVAKGFLDNTPVYTVPAGHCFVLGDHRDNSADSRSMSQVGFVPLANITGRSFVIFFSTDPQESLWKVWRWPWAIRWSRLFTRVR